MDIPRDERQEEPNVVPLIDISLVILVMALVISSVADRLLSMELPKAEQTHFVEAGQTTALTVNKDGACQLGSETWLRPADMSPALGRLEPGTIVVIATEPGTRYEHVVAAVDAVRGNPGLKVAFGRMGRTNDSHEKAQKAQE
jgi:biopolymer transport protein ExbD